ncbi:MAG: hypothetical protein WCK92_07925 [Bacteroidota bacterium]
MKTTIKKKCSNITENNSVVINDTTVSTDGNSSTGLVSDSNNGFIPENLDSFQERLSEILNIFDNLTRGNVIYDPTVKDLEYSINHLKRRIEWVLGDMDRMFFDFGLTDSVFFKDLHEEVSDRLNDILSQFRSLQEDNTIGFSEPVVQEILFYLRIDQSTCSEYLSKKMNQKNVLLKKFQSILQEYEPVVNQILEKVLNHKVTPEFINQMKHRVSKPHSRLEDLLIEVTSFLKKRKSTFNWRMYENLVSFIESNLSIYDRLFDCIILSEEKGFDTLDEEFLDILDYNESQEYFDIDEIRDRVLHN